VLIQAYYAVPLQAISAAQVQSYYALCEISNKNTIGCKIEFRLKIWPKTCGSPKSQSATNPGAIHPRLSLKREPEFGQELL
jgi:hypothetical protein